MKTAFSAMIGILLSFGQGSGRPLTFKPEREAPPQSRRHRKFKPSRVSHRGR